MRIKLILVCLALVALASSANAFPLSGGNGIVNATVLGMYIPLDKVIVLDITGSEHFQDSNVVLVDADDKFHQAMPSTHVGEHNAGSIFESPDTIDRNLYAFGNVPPKTEIKRVRFTPDEGDPFSIEWTGVPEVKGVPISIKFYGLESIVGGQEYHSFDTYREVSGNQWIADVKLTNTLNNFVEIKGIDFAMIDQFNFSYYVHYSDIKNEKLLPNESMRISIPFEMISKLSRPIYLIYKPSNLKMDISAWT